MEFIKATFAVLFSLSLFSCDEHPEQKSSEQDQAMVADNTTNETANETEKNNTDNQSTDQSSNATQPSTDLNAINADITQGSDDFYADAQNTLQEKLSRQPNTKKAKNVILLVADGNGINTNYATRLYMGQKAGSYGDEFVMPKEKLPYLALSKTYNTNAQTPDSSGTATALNTGIKTKSGVVGLSSQARRGQCEDVADNKATGFATIATKQGKSVGVVSTARLTHATPAAVYAHSGDRDWEAKVPEGCDQKDIAQQLISRLKDSTVDIALGGGSRNFSVSRKDKVDLVQTAQDQGVQILRNLEDLKNANLDGKTPTLGLFSSSHMSYEADRKAGEPSIVDMTESAINYLSKNKEGYYLMIEAGRVDHANHFGNAYRALSDGEAFDKAVEKAIEMTDDETLIIVTADHAHTMALNGYAGRGSDILGLTYKIDDSGVKHLNDLEKASDGKPFSIISYANGPGSVLKRNNNGTYTGERGDLTQDVVMAKDYKQQALLPKLVESHSGADVAIYAKGPWAHLFDGTVEQNYIFHVMNHAINNGQ